MTAPVTGLTCNTTYHYQVRAENSVGVTSGSDATFKTLSCNLTDLTVTLDDKLTLLSAGDSYSYTAIVKNVGTTSNADKALFKAPAVTGIIVNSVICGTPVGDAACPAAASVTPALLQGTGIIIPTLPKVSSVTFTINATVKTGAALGNLAYTTTVVAPATVVDVNQLNNTAVDVDRIVNRPDFTVTDISLAPSDTLTAQTTFTATVTVKNQGAVVGNAGVLGLWLNKSGTTAIACKTTTDAQQDAGILAAGAQKVFTFAGLSSGLAGVKNLAVLIDSTCLTAESKSDNNQLSQAYTVVAPTVAALTPDFVIISATLTPAIPVANGTFSLAVKVKNQGNAESDIAFIDVWANQATSPACGASGTVWKDVPKLSSTSTNDANITTITLTGIPAGAAGAKTLQIFVDSWCEIAESSETNNKQAKSYTVH